jgi:hypothetical protein
MASKMIDDVIFDNSLRCLWAHCHPEWGDRLPLDVFNRLLAKNIRNDGWTKNTHLTIQPQQVASRQEQWTTDDLAKLPRGHGSSKGDDFACPIVIVEYDGAQRLLDGNHRINRWIATGDTRLHAVNIHAISGSGQFVVLPTTANGA